MLCPKHPAGIKIVGIALTALLLTPMFASGSKSSQVKSDMRVLATAVESYNVDYNTYPAPAPGQRLPEPALTTPISHVTRAPTDYFRRTHIPQYARHWPDYVLHSWVKFVPLALALWVAWIVSAIRRDNKRKTFFITWAACTIVFTIVTFCLPINVHYGDLSYPVKNPLGGKADKRFNYYTNETSFFIIQSIGPNGERDLLDLAKFGQPEAYEEVLNCFYDPTNGTRSRGDVFRLSENFWWR